MKKEILEKTMNYIQQHPITRNMYISSETEPKFDGTDSFCYCAVGFILKEVGVSDEELFELDAVAGDSEPISVLGIMNPNVEDHKKNTFLIEIKQKLIQNGFNEDELNQIQSYNDAKNKVELLNYLQKLI